MCHCAKYKVQSSKVQRNRSVVFKELLVFRLLNWCDFSPFRQPGAQASDNAELKHTIMSSHPYLCDHNVIVILSLIHECSFAGNPISIDQQMTM